MPKDIEPFLNGRSYKDLKAGDEIAFPELIVPESLVGRRFAAVDSDGNKFEAIIDGFDPSTREHAVVFDNGVTGSWDIKGPSIKKDIFNKGVTGSLVFEGADAYFDGRGVCTIREFPFII